MHKLLARQLRRKASIANDIELAQALADLTQASGQQGWRPESLRLLAALPALVNEIENTYCQFDRDLELRRRSLEVSSEELLHLNNQLRNEAASRQRALDMLREAANRLLIGAGLAALQDGETHLESLSSRMAEIAHEREAALEKQRESEARLLLALNVTESVAWDWDIASNKLVVISTGDEVLGYPRERIENDPPRIGELIDPAERGFLRERLVAHLRGQTPEFKFGVWMTVKGRDRRYMQFHGKVVARDASGRALRMAGIMHDLTANKHTEEALRESQVAAEAATRAKSQFLANMSHEIRTPMNGLLGMTELLLGTPLDAKQRQFAETARRSGEALLALVNDILDFSKIEAGKMEIERVEFTLRDMLEDVGQLLAESAAAKGLELVCRVHPNVPAVITGDPNRVRQVLINLLGNAIKFTERGEVVTEARMTDDPHSGRRVLCFEVRDTGIGIAREAQAHVFEAFNQADGSTTRHYGGTGLGLAICRQLVTLMGGALSLQSEPGRGSTFRFTLPCEKPAARNRQAAAPHAALLHARRLLIVDDNAACRDTVRELAQSVFGMRCEVAADGIAALQLARLAHARGEPFDAALLDAAMPGLDGFALAGALRADPTLKDTRLVLSVPFDSDADARRAERMNAAGFAAAVTKPVRQGDLLRALLSAFGGDAGDVAQKHHTVAPHAGTATARYAGRVLVAEDNPVNQQVIRAVLEDCGLQVHVASNGREAVEAAQRGQFELVFMDCQMPELDGYMATRAIRAFESEAPDSVRARRTPIVALTAHATQADRERCIDAGMDSYVSKPFTQAILRRELDRWLPLHGEAESIPQRSAFAVHTQRLDLRALGELRALDPLSKGMLQGLVATYVKHTKTLLGELRRAVTQGDHAAIAREAHKLKSGSVTIGAARVGKLANALEQASQAGDLAHCQMLLTDIHVEFDHAQILLMSELQAASKAA